MNNKMITAFLILVSFGFLIFYKVNCSAKQKDKKIIQIILGSTRNGRMSSKIVDALKKLVNRDDVSLKIIDLKDYNLPFLYDETPPRNQKEIKDPIIKKWSDNIKQSDAIIILSPEYNSSIPGVLKNALDLLYNEWNNKPVGLITYSGGPTGGTNAASHLNQIVSELKMNPVKTSIKISSSWKALDEKGNFNDQSIKVDFNNMINELISKLKK